MPEAIAIRISGIISKIPAGRILEPKIPDPITASGRITTETRSAMAAPITMEQGRMPPAIDAIRIHRLMATIMGREPRSSRLEDRRIMATTLRNSPVMRTTEIAETQADGVSTHISPNRMETTTEVLASSRLEDRRITDTTLRNSPPMQTAEIVETRGPRINFLIHPNRMEMAIEVLASSRLEHRQDQPIIKVAHRIPRSR
jgi:hypothetical protein